MQQRKAGRESKHSPKKKLKHRGGMYPAVTFVVIVLAIVFAMSVFFKVSQIKVVGNSLYSEEQIIQASGIDKGDNLFFVNRISAVSKIFAKLPYVAKAEISRGLPNRVTITVTESQALAYISLDKTNWTLDGNCKILGKAEGTEAAKLIRVDGIKLLSPSIGAAAKAEAGDQAKLTYLADILGQIQERSLKDYITAVDMSTITNPSFDYMGRFTVKLGSDQNTEYKFGLLLSAVTQLEDGAYGTFDLSIDKQAHFSPN